jgi:hypothetical protein
MPLVGFKLTIPAFERAEMVHALDSTATVIDVGKLTEGNSCTDVFEFPTGLRILEVC